MNSSQQPRRNNNSHRAEQPTLSVNLSGKKHQLNVEQAFSLAHQFVGRGSLESASSVLEWLEDALPNDRRVKVLHARCEARRGHYAVCNQLLNEIYLETDQSGDFPGSLHSAIVYRAVGLYTDARNGLTELCEAHPQLPSLWLFAGDLWQVVGHLDKAQLAWTAAIRHDDQEPRVVATAARHRIRELGSNNLPT